MWWSPRMLTERRTRSIEAPRISFDVGLYSSAVRAHECYLLSFHQNVSPFHAVISGSISCS